MWPQSFCARECEESNPDKKPCRLACPDYVYSGAVSFSLHTNLSYSARATEEEKTLFINDAAPTTRSPINLALGISKLLTLRLALCLFRKSSNNGTAVYIVLAIWDRMNCCTSTTWERVEGRGRVLHTQQNEWIYTLKYVYIHQCLEYVPVVHIEIY